MSGDANSALIDLNARSRDMIAEFFAEVALAAGPVIMVEYAKGCEVQHEKRTAALSQ